MYNISYKTFNPFTPATNQDYSYVLGFKQGDIDGDGIIDNVFLIGHKTNPKEIFSDNISIVIQNGRTNLYSQIPLINAAGYNGQLLLAPFSSREKLDILVSIDTGGSGGYVKAYLYSIYNNKPVSLFYSDRFDAFSAYNVKFLDNYKVNIAGKNNDSSFIIDVSDNREKYIKKNIYNKKGRLKDEYDGTVLGIGALYPIVSNYKDIYELLTYQRIIGINNADNIGTIQTYLKWNGKELKPYRVEASIS